LLLKYGH